MASLKRNSMPLGKSLLITLLLLVALFTTTCASESTEQIKINLKKQQKQKQSKLNHKFDDLGKKVEKSIEEGFKQQIIRNINGLRTLQTATNNLKQYHKNEKDGLELFSMDQDDAFIIPTSPSFSRLESLSIKELLDLQSDLQANVKHEVDDVQVEREEAGKTRIEDQGEFYDTWFSSENQSTDFQEQLEMLRRLRKSCGKLPIVGQEESQRQDIEDSLINFRAIMDGLNREEEYYQLVKCYYNVLNLEVRLAVSWNALVNFTDKADANATELSLFGDYFNKGEIYEFLLAIGNISSTFKNCTNIAEEQIQAVFAWMSQWPNFQTYILYLIPNLLSQAIVINRYLTRIEIYQEQGNDTGIYFEYSKIFRKIFIFDLPDLDEDFEDLDTQTSRIQYTRRHNSSRHVQSSSTVQTIQWLLNSPIRWLQNLSSNFVTIDHDQDEFSPNREENKSYLHPLVEEQQPEGDSESNLMSQILGLSSSILLQQNMSKKYKEVKQNDITEPEEGGFMDDLSALQEASNWLSQNSIDGENKDEFDEESFNLYKHHGQSLLKSVLKYEFRILDRIERMSSLFLDAWQLRENSIFEGMTSVIQKFTGGSKLKIQQETIDILHNRIGQQLETLDTLMREQQRGQCLVEEERTNLQKQCLKLPVRTQMNKLSMSLHYKKDVQRNYLDDKTESLRQQLYRQRSKTNGIHSSPIVGQMQKDQSPDPHAFVDPYYVSTTSVLLFIAEVPLYFTITLMQDPNAFNFLDGCRNAWFSFVYQFVIIYELSILVPHAFTDYRGNVAVQYMKDLTFAYFTPLEFLYPMTAYCETSIYQFVDTNVNLYNFFAFNFYQVVFNIIRKLGTIMFNFMTFFDCFNQLDGECAGLKSGRFWYWLFDYRNYYDAARIDYYESQLEPVKSISDNSTSSSQVDFDSFDFDSFNQLQ